jgi:hypothetical protein
MNETRILRERLGATSDRLDTAQGAPPLHGSAAVLGITTTVTSYPTTAAAFYAMLPQEVDGSETEGSAASYTASSSTPFYGYNAGTQVPPAGTPVVCHAVGGRWVFRYDGSGSSSGGSMIGGGSGAGGGPQGSALIAARQGRPRRGVRVAAQGHV